MDSSLLFLQATAGKIFAISIAEFSSPFSTSIFVLNLVIKMVLNCFRVRTFTKYFQVSLDFPSQDFTPHLAPVNKSTFSLIEIKMYSFQHFFQLSWLLYKKVYEKRVFENDEWKIITFHSLAN